MGEKGKLKPDDVDRRYSVQTVSDAASMSEYETKRKHKRSKPITG